MDPLWDVHNGMILREHRRTAVDRLHPRPPNGERAGQQLLNGVGVFAKSRRTAGTGRDTTFRRHRTPNRYRGSELGQLKPF